MDDNTIILFGHAAYTLIFFSFLVRKMLWLRTLAIVAGVSSIIYNFHIAANPLWVPIQWNILFITTNIIQITFILLNKRKISFEGDEKFLYDNVFKLFTPMEFKKLIKVGHFRHDNAKTTLIEKDIPTDGLFLLVEGVVGIEVNGQKVASLNEGDFIGEMSFLTKEMPKADVITRSHVRYLVWSKSELSQFLEKNPTIMARFQATIGKQLIDELVAKSLEKAPLKLVA